MTILNEVPVLTNFEMAMIAIFIIMGCIGITLAITYEFNDERFFISTCLILIVVSFLIIVPTMSKKCKLKRLEVLIENNYPFQKIYDNYEVKDKRGDIWILEEKK